MNEKEPVNILMVDDQAAKLLSYEAILGDMGECLLKASSAREALDLLLRHDMAIILIDVNMPEMDGFELAELIRQHPRFQKLAIIFISAVNLTELDRLKGYELGAVDYLPVPVVPEILRAKVSVFAELHRKTHQLEQLNLELERRVAERTIELEAALRTRDNFIAIAAHELKTPVTALRIAAQVITNRLQRGGEMDSAWLGTRISVVDRQSARLSRLIAQLLNVSRLEQDKLIVERSLNDLGLLTQQVVDAAQMRTTLHQLVFTADGNLHINIDPDAIEQVISNLLDNAIKYSPEGGQIDIDVRPFAPSFIRLKVRDRGIGIPVENRAAIFKRFYQAHTDDHRSGLGLGLYISQQIVEAHDGCIDVEFPPDGGTCFVVTLPGPEVSPGLQGGQADLVKLKPLGKEKQ